jgi:hypothetical protein
MAYKLFKVIRRLSTFGFQATSHHLSHDCTTLLIFSVHFSPSSVSTANHILIDQAVHRISKQGCRDDHLRWMDA